MSRLTYIAKRLALSIPVIVFGTSLTFIIIRVGPIDPAAAILGPNQTPQAVERYEQIRAQLGLDQPLWEQYIQFMIEMLTFDLGASWVVEPGADVNQVLFEYMPRTLWLGFWSVMIALLVGIPLGFYAGLNPNTPADYFASFGGIVWRAMPNFWLAIILVALLAQSQRFLFGFDYAGWLVQTDVVGTPDLSNLTDPPGFSRRSSRSCRPRSCWDRPRWATRCGSAGPRCLRRSTRTTSRPPRPKALLAAASSGNTSSGML